MTDGRARRLLGEVAQGVRHAAEEATHHMQNNEAFREIGKVMLLEWSKGLSLSIELEKSEQ